MPFLVSPGVAVVEKDFSSIVPAVSSSTGAFAGPFSWGPVNSPLRISSENELVAKLGKPTDANYQSFFSAANFLAYTNTLYVNRTDADGLVNASTVQSGPVSSGDISITVQGSGYTAAEKLTATVTFAAPSVGGSAATGTLMWEEYDAINGLWRVTGIQVTSGGIGYTVPPSVTISAPAAGTGAQATVSKIVKTGVKIKNIDDYLENFGSHLHNGEFAAKYAGSRANGVMVYVIDANNWAGQNAEIKKQFSGAPGTSDYAATNVGANALDELHILVVDNAKGNFSGVGSTVLEKFEFVSKLRDAKKSDGTNIYYKDVLANQSAYLWSLATPAATQTQSLALAQVSVTTATDGTITITDNAAFDNLLQFMNERAASASTVSFKIILGSGANAGTHIVTNVQDTGTSYVITTTSSLVAETIATSLTSVEAADWGLSSQELAGSDLQLAVMNSTAVAGLSLSGGADGAAPTDGEIQSAYSAFANTDDYEISLIVAGNVSTTVANYLITGLAETRKDCIAFISPRNANGNHWITSTQAGTTPEDAAIAYKNAINTSSSYGVIDSGWKYQYDAYNDKYRWIPLNGDTAGLCARVDFTADPWYSPGGFNRGQIKNVVKLGYNPNQTQRDALYQEGINPVVIFPGQGTVLYGDKTMLAKPSAFDRINVRRLFIVLEKAIATAAKYQLFEFNDSFTRAQFRNLVEPFLRDVQGRRGVVDFKVVCDETNNTGEVIDRNEFAADIYIKPNRSINFITLNFIAARSSVSFSELGA